MAIHLEKTISDVYCGDDKVNKMYIGSSLVYRNLPFTLLTYIDNLNVQGYDIPLIGSLGNYNIQRKDISTIPSICGEIQTARMYNGNLHYIFKDSKFIEFFARSSIGESSIYIQDTSPILSIHSRANGYDRIIFRKNKNPQNITIDTPIIYKNAEDSTQIYYDFRNPLPTNRLAHYTLQLFDHTLCVYLDGTKLISAITTATAISQISSYVNQTYLLAITEICAKIDTQYQQSGFVDRNHLYKDII